MTTCLLDGCELETPSLRHKYCTPKHCDLAYRARNKERIKAQNVEYNIRRVDRRRKATGRSRSTKREQMAGQRPDYIQRIRARVDPVTHSYKS